MLSYFQKASNDQKKNKKKGGKKDVEEPKSPRGNLSSGFDIVGTKTTKQVSNPSRPGLDIQAHNKSLEVVMQNLDSALKSSPRSNPSSKYGSPLKMDKESNFDSSPNQLSNGRNATAGGNKRYHSNSLYSFNSFSSNNTSVDHNANTSSGHQHRMSNHLQNQDSLNSNAYSMDSVLEGSVRPPPPPMLNTAQSSSFSGNGLNLPGLGMKQVGQRSAVKANPKGRLLGRTDSLVYDMVDQDIFQKMGNSRDSNISHANSSSYDTDKNSFKNQIKSRSKNNSVDISNDNEKSSNNDGESGEDDHEQELLSREKTYKIMTDSTPPFSSDTHSNIDGGHSDSSVADHNDNDNDNDNDDNNSSHNDEIDKEKSNENNKEKQEKEKNLNIASSFNNSTYVGYNVETNEIEEPLSNTNTKIDNPHDISDDDDDDDDNSDDDDDDDDAVGLPPLNESSMTYSDDNIVDETKEVAQGKKSCKCDFLSCETCERLQKEILEKDIAYRQQFKIIENRLRNMDNLAAVLRDTLNQYLNDPNNIGSNGAHDSNNSKISFDIQKSTAPDLSSEMNRARQTMAIIKKNGTYSDGESKTENNNNNHNNNSLNNHISTINQIQEIPHHLIMQKSDIRLDELVGRGSYGEVWRGWYRNKLVAIKIFFSEDENIAAEVIIMNKVGGKPHVLSLEGVVIDDDNPNEEPKVAVVTRYMANGSLHDMLINKDSPNYRASLSMSMIVRMATQASEGVCALHENGIIHRDLACRNFLVDEKFDIYVCDFGFARLRDNATNKQFTKTNVGPIRWEAPESLRYKEYSEKSDVFSFSVALYEMIGGKEPWEGKTAANVAYQVLLGARMEIPLHCDPAIAHVIEKSWATDPEERPQMKEVYYELKSRLDELEKEDIDVAAKKSLNSALRQGTIFYKLPHLKGKPHKRHFRVTPDLRQLSWGFVPSAKQIMQRMREPIRTAYKSINLVEIIEIRIGLSTEGFKRIESQPKFLGCPALTIILRERTIELLAKSAEVLDQWVTGLNMLIYRLRKTDVNVPCLSLKTTSDRCDLIALLRRGSYLLKYVLSNTGGKPHERYVKLSGDMKSIFWTSGEINNQGENKSCNLLDAVEVVEFTKAKNKFFDVNSQLYNTMYGFSILDSKGNVMFTVVAPNPEMYDIWTNGLKLILDYWSIPSNRDSIPNGTPNPHGGNNHPNISFMNDDDDNNNNNNVLMNNNNNINNNNNNNNNNNLRGEFNDSFAPTYSQAGLLFNDGVIEMADGQQAVM